MVKGWASIGDLKGMTRAEVVSWCDLLDAVDEAESEAAAKPTST